MVASSKAKMSATGVTKSAKGLATAATSKMKRKRKNATGAIKKAFKSGLASNGGATDPMKDRIPTTKPRTRR